ncbi:MAG: hypothetical protein LM601_09650 [Candidatus Verstraetearchaeota archaeon]|nr:hypothetical protein [Candidatus Verstraetearchaeota archaeon]
MKPEYNTLPGCFAMYPRAMPPNKCETCPYTTDCKKCLRKEALKTILMKIEEIEKKLR